MKKQDIIKVLELLEQLYPDAKPELHFSNPYETLISVMLSAQSTDVQVNKVTQILFAQFPDVRALAEANVDAVFQIVRSCGFKSKATNIVEASKLILMHHDGQVPGNIEALMALPGVGRKTANVVLANAFHVPAIAVDTHVFRVSNRIGLTDAKNVDETEKQLRQIVPIETWIKAHHWLIYHGRRVCSARRPNCDTCAIASYCKYQKNQ